MVLQGLFFMKKNYRTSYLKRIAIVQHFVTYFLSFFPLMKKRTSPNASGGQAKKNLGSEIKAKNYVLSLNPAKIAGKVISFVVRAGSNIAGILTALDIIFLTLFFRGRPTFTMSTNT